MPITTIRPDPVLADLGPLQQLRAGRLPRRLTQLTAGLLLYGASLALIVRAAWGTAPWEVLHLGLAARVPLSLGAVLVVVSVLVLLAWIPLRQRPGLGTVANALLVGVAADLTLAVVPPLPADGLADAGLRFLVLLAAITLNGVATAAYIGAQLGPGPRDGLMTGVARRTGGSVRLVRTGIELAVVLLGVLLGGPLGVGTVLYALAIGPLTQLFLPRLVVALPGAAGAGRVSPNP